MQTFVVVLDVVVVLTKYHVIDALQTIKTTPMCYEDIYEVEKSYA